VLGRHVEHLLRVPHAADAAPRQGLVPHDEIKRRDLESLGGQADHDHLAVGLEQAHERRQGDVGGHRVDDAIHGARRRLHLLGVLTDDEGVGAEPVHGLLLLPRRRADDGDLHPERRLGELDGDVAKAAQPQHADVLPGLVQAVVLHGAVHGDAGAQQRRAAVQRHPVGEPHHEPLVHRDAARVAAVGHGAVAVDGVVGEDDAAAAGVLEALGAAVARLARVHHAAHADAVAGVEPRHVLAHLRHHSGDLVARDHGVHGVAPLVLDAVQVRVAHPTEQDLYRYIIVSSAPA